MFAWLIVTQRVLALECRKGLEVPGPGFRERKFRGIQLGDGTTDPASPRMRSSWSADWFGFSALCRLSANFWEMHNREHTPDWAKLTKS